MWKLTMRGLAANKLRLLTTAMAVVLGVAFMAGTLVLTDTIGRTFDGLFTDSYKGTDAYVRSSQVVKTNFSTTRTRVDESLVATVAHVDGVAAAEPFVSGYAQLVGHDGKAVGNPGNGAPSFGQSWLGNTSLNPYHVVEGTAPTRDNEIVIDRHSANVADFHVGDQVTVLTKSSPHQFTISGIAKFGTADSMGGINAVLMTPAMAESVVSSPGRIDAVVVKAQPGVSQADLSAHIRAALPNGTESLTGAQITKETKDDVTKGLSFFSAFLLTFAGIALFVGSFIIYNTFSIIVAQRSKELALLRALGASRRQVRRTVILEALVVGVVASAIGIGVGIAVALGLHALLGALGVDIPAEGVVITQSTIITSLVVGTLVTLRSAIMPARRASKVPPVAALRDQAIDQTRVSHKRTVGGVIVTLAAAGALTAGLAGGGIALVGIGALGVFVGVSMLGPLLARPAARLIGSPLPRIKGPTGRLARENAMRNPKRTASTAAALMIGVALVGSITVLAASAKTTINSAVDNQFTGDFVVSSNQEVSGGLSPQLTAAIAKLPEVGAVTPMRMVPASVDGTSEVVPAFDPATVTKLYNLGSIQGDITHLGLNGAAISQRYAKEKHWKLGDTVSFRFAKTGNQNFVIQGIYKEGDVALGPGFISIAAASANLDDQFDASIYVKTAAGVSQADARAALTKATNGYATAKLLDRSEFKANQASQINGLLNLIYALLGLALIIALMGIANTLALSIVERTRELGLLRAVGMTRAQLRSSVRWEAVIIALFGTAMGLSIGLFFGWSLVHALSSSGFDKFTIPVSQLTIISVIAAVAAVGAAILPARRAAKLDVLKAIATQ